MIPVLPEQTVWYSFPNGQGFRGTNMNQGQVCMFVHVDIDLSKHTMCPGLKLFACFHSMLQSFLLLHENGPDNQVLAKLYSL
jgi:hypothetical protein